MFYVGQKVVCIRDDWAVYRGESVPKRNQVYTIREIRAEDDKLYLLLIEITNPPLDYQQGFEEPSFWSVGFRPLVERKTDIGIFERLLNPSKQTEDA